MAYGNSKHSRFLTHRIRTSSGMEDIKYLIGKTAAMTYNVYTSAKSSGTVAGTSAGSTWAPDGTSGWSTLDTAAKTRVGAFRMARKAARKLDIGTGRN